MHDEYLRSDCWEKFVRASRLDASLRHKFPYSGKRGSADHRRWGGKVPISHDPDYDYPHEVGGLHSHEIIFLHYEGKADGGFSYNCTSRWLDKQVGRPWNDIWAEICSRFDSRSYRGREIRNDFNGKWIFDHDCYHSIDGNIRETRSCGIVHGLYIHPDTGILCSSSTRYPSYRSRHRNDKFISDEIGVYEGRGFYIGMHGETRPSDYRFVHLTCGTASKRPTKNLGKTWFCRWTEVIETYRIWWASPSQDCDDLYYTGKGYVTDSEGVWGEFREQQRTVAHEKSCNHKQLVWIANFEKEIQSHIVRGLKHENDSRRRNNVYFSIAHSAWVETNNNASLS